MIGQKFGKLLVIKEAFRKDRSIYWECGCDCGKSTVACTGKLQIGHVKSCGCSKKVPSKKFGKNHQGWCGCGEISGSIWNRIKQCAKQRKKEFSISIEEAWELYNKQGGKCALSGVSIKFAESCQALIDGENTCSLDRIDSTRGYVSGNIQWVHVVVNYMKQEFTQHEFVEWCGKIWNNFGGKNG